MAHLTDQQIETALLNGTNAEELRTDLGDVTYQELRSLGAELSSHRADALASEAFGFGRKRKKTVFVLPGIMGSKLAVKKGGDHNLVWFEPTSLALGHVSQLKYRPADDGVIPAGVFWSAYGRLRLRLATKGYDVRFVSFDWRRPTDELGEIAHRQIAADGDSNITVIAHSMGGLLARHIAARDKDTRQIDRVITIGTPNGGSYSPVMVFRNAHTLVAQLGRLDQSHTAEEIVRDVLRGFPGLVEMMPDPELRPTENFFDHVNWPDSKMRPLAAVLDAALEARRKLPPPDDRFHQIIGIGERTPVSTRTDGKSLSFLYSLDGDGTVPRDLAEIDGLPKTFVEDSHGGMLSNKAVYTAVLSLLQGKPPKTRAERARYAPQILFESLDDLSVSEDDLRSRIQAQTGHAERVTDVAAEFLGVERRPAERATGAATAPVAPDLPRIGGYPAHLVRQATENWQAAEQQRNTAEQAAVRGGPLAAESRDRKPIYARRMAERLMQIAKDTPGDVQMPPELQKVAAMAELDTSAATAVLLNERVLGVAEDFLSVMYLKRGAIVAKSVGCIVHRSTHQGFGSGFLVAPGVLMTNHHVLGTEAEAREAAVQFDFELSYRYRQITAETFELRPQDLFHADRSLDFALVAVAPTSLGQGFAITDYGYLPLDERVGKIRAEGAINIIQHPAAGLKQVIFRDSKLYAMPSELDPGNSYSGKSIDMAAHYTGDTKPGSSGSPCFSDTWEVVALHHSAVAELNAQGQLRMQDGSFKHVADIRDGDSVKWLANEGIRISRIMRHLRGLMDDGAFTGTELDLVQRVIAVGDKAGRDGAFNRPLPRRIFSTMAERERHSLPRETESLDGVPAGGTAPEAGVSSAASVWHTRQAGNRIHMTVPLNIELSLGVPAEMSGGANALSSLQPTLSAAGPTEIDTERPATSMPLADRTGYDSDFVGLPVPMPSLRSTELGRPAMRLDGMGTRLDYDHYSVVMNADRRTAYVSAGNYDPQAPWKPARDASPWGFDPRISASEQAGNQFYKGNDLDRGHLFRRVDGSWGYTEDAALRADHDTYFWTNIAPQHKAFNQSHLQGLWGRLENLVMEQANASGTRFSVFNGPIFEAGDRTHRDLKIPKGFWKLIAFAEHGTLRAMAFRLGQEELLVDLPLERIELEEFGVFQISIPDLSRLVHLDFGPVAAADTMARGASPMEAAGGYPREIRITSPSDIRA
ncbi:DNA/RNA non-specific endonuclease [Tropicimonas sp. TH_r6]|uniref:DNA/RNA non-specific endonuclease n=1 Tax=Tropicimonas sp. TH_r6 TaxID=3082085 RepID=UPI0029556310|nr:DNA/RNA non-specific endonuclease [Tropicimonas sp. TH_r6]MDV7143987.1 DNA/RNA non-specific endonuclease [Tropicimonas sp. TH_r6]